MQVARRCEELTYAVTRKADAAETRDRLAATRSELQVRQKRQQLNCLHRGLEVLNNPAPPPSI